MRRRNKKNFLKSVCPFEVLEEKVTWGEFIVMQFKALVGVALFFVYYIGFFALADIVGVAD